MRQDASGELVAGGFVTSFELGDLDADARAVQVTIFELTGSPGSGSAALIKDDHVRLRWRGLGVSSHADVKGRRFRLAAEGSPPRVRVGGPLEASLFWSKPVPDGIELCAAIGFGSDAFLALDHETFDATPAARVVYDGGREALVLLSERC